MTGLTNVRGLAYPEALKRLPGFADTSYGNDSCDSVMFVGVTPLLDQLVGYRLWIEYADPAEREREDDHRFTLVRVSPHRMGDAFRAGADSLVEAISEGENHDVVLSTEDPAAIMAYLEARPDFVCEVCGGNGFNDDAGAPCEACGS